MDEQKKQPIGVDPEPKSNPDQQIDEAGRIQGENASPDDFEDFVNPVNENTVDNDAAGENDKSLTPRTPKGENL